MHCFDFRKASKEWFSFHPPQKKTDCIKTRNAKWPRCDISENSRKAKALRSNKPQSSYFGKNLISCRIAMVRDMSRKPNVHVFGFMFKMSTFTQHALLQRSSTRNFFTVNTYNYFCHWKQVLRCGSAYIVVLRNWYQWEVSACWKPDLQRERHG